MKTFLALLVCALPFSVDSQLSLQRAPYPALFKATASGTCNTAKETFNNANNGSFDSSQGYLWFASRFIVSGTGTRCKANCYMSKAGTPGGNMTFQLYDHDAVLNQPTTQIGSSSANVLCTTPGATEAQVLFDTWSASVTDLKTNWFVVKFPAGHDASNNVLWYTQTAVGSDFSKVSGNGGLTWDNLGHPFKVIIYTSP